MNGVKSLIGKYKDNRFNGIYETSAEVSVRAQEWLSASAREDSTSKHQDMKTMAVKVD